MRLAAPVQLPTWLGGDVLAHAAGAARDSGSLGAGHATLVALRAPAKAVGWKGSRARQGEAAGRERLAGFRAAAQHSAAVG